MADSTVSTRFEVKLNPVDAPVTKIVEAFGDRKCSKLVEQVADDNLDVRVNALAVLCDEVNNPYSILGCSQAGVVPILGSMCTDSDYTTRQRASKALSTMASDASGLNSILENVVIPEILKGIYDPEYAVRLNVYNCLLHCTRTTAGAEACVDASVTASLAALLFEENDKLKPLLLRSLYNISRTESGLEETLNANVVEICIDLLGSHVPDVRSDAARTLGFLCFSDEAKERALQHNAVAVVMGLLANLEEVVDVKSNGTMALMAITTTDEGKRQMAQEIRPGSEEEEAMEKKKANGEEPPVSWLSTIISLLYDENRLVKMNSLKIISNIAVYPILRELMKSDNSCLVVIRRLKNNTEDALMAKHAAVALAAVLAMP